MFSIQSRVPAHLNLIPLIYKVGATLLCPAACFMISFYIHDPFYDLFKKGPEDASAFPTQEIDRPGDLDQ